MLSRPLKPDTKMVCASVCVIDNGWLVFVSLERKFTVCVYSRMSLCRCEYVCVCRGSVCVCVRE